MTNEGQHHRDTITIGIMTLATVVLAAMIGLLEISGANPVHGERPDALSDGSEPTSAPASASDEADSAIQRIADTVRGLVSLFAAFALLLYLWCLFAGTEALLRSAREQPDVAAVRYTQAIASFQGLVLLVVFIAALSIFVNYADSRPALPTIAEPNSWTSDCQHEASPVPVCPSNVPPVTAVPA